MMSVVTLIIVGLLTGALASALGIGGGIIFVPALIFILGFEQHLAQGTSLAIIAGTSMVATAIHYRRGRVDAKVGAIVGGVGVIGAVLGSRLALALDGEVLRRLFAALLVIMATRLLIQSFGSATKTGHVDDGTPDDSTR